MQIAEKKHFILKQLTLIGYNDCHFVVLMLMLHEFIFSFIVTESMAPCGVYNGIRCIKLRCTICLIF